MCTVNNGLFLAGLAGRTYPGKYYSTVGRCCGVGIGPAKTGREFLGTYTGCCHYRNQFNSYVINNRFSGRNSVRSAFYSGCVKR